MSETQAPSAPAEQATPNQNTEQTQADTAEVSAADAIPEWKKAKHKIPHLKNDDGSEVEMDYDEMVKLVALNKTITQRGQEAAKTKKEADAQIAKFQRDLDACKGNPKLLFELAKSIGVDQEQMKAVAEELVWEEIQFSKIKNDPEKLKAYEDAQELRRLKQEKEEREANEKKAKEAEIDQQCEKEIEDCVLDTVKLLKQKPNPALMSRIAEHIQREINAKGTLPSPEKIAKKVRDWYHQDYVDLYDSDEVSVEELIELGLLTDKRLNKIQKYLLDKASKNVPSFAASRQATTATKQAPKKQKVGVDDFFKKLGS